MGIRLPYQEYYLNNFGYYPVMQNVSLTIFFNQLLSNRTDRQYCAFCFNYWII